MNGNADDFKRMLSEARAEGYYAGCKHTSEIMQIENNRLKDEIDRLKAIGGDGLALIDERGDYGR